MDLIFLFVNLAREDVRLCQESVRKVSEKCQESVRKLSGKCQESVRMCLEEVRRGGGGVGVGGKGG